MDKSTIEISRRGTRNPNVWWAVLGVAPCTTFGMLLLTSGLPEWASAALALAAGLCAGSTIALVAHAFCRRGVVDGRGYTESMSFFGWTLWQESYADSDIHSIAIDGQCSADADEPYAYRFYLQLKNGMRLPSFVFVRKQEAETLLTEIMSGLGRGGGSS